MAARRRAREEHVDRVPAPRTDDDRRATVGDVLSQVADDLDAVETHPTSICVIELTPRGLVVRSTADLAPLGAHVRGILEHLDGAPAIELGERDDRGSNLDDNDLASRMDGVEGGARHAPNHT